VASFLFRRSSSSDRVASNTTARRIFETIVGSWRKRLAILFELAKVKNGHPHRFRYTFAFDFR
jgi:integrase